MEFKVGDRVVVNMPSHNRHGRKGEIVGNHAEPNFLMVEYEDGRYEEWHPSKLKKLEPETQFEYKIGDRFIINQKDSIENWQIIKNGEEVEFIGIRPNDKNNIMVRNKNNICVPFALEDLKPLPSPLKEGQEVWVKGILTDPSVDIYGDMRLTRNYSGKESATSFAHHNSIYIKNDQGQIVPYKGE